MAVEEPEGLEAWRLFLRAHAAVVRDLEHDLAAKQRLPLSWYDALLELRSAPERRLRMQALADRVTLSRSRVSRVVDELVRAGYVERVPDPEDGRAAFAAITEAGTDALRRAAPDYLRGVEEHFLGVLTAAERSAIERGLRRVLEAHASE